MATNKPDSRKTHIIRILGTNKNDDVLPDIWVDVERIDWFNFVHAGEGADNFGERVGSAKKLRWADDPLSNDYNPDGLASRKTVIVKVCNPSEPNLDDPEEWVPIKAIKYMNAVQSRDNYMALGERQRNDPDDGVVDGGGRKVEVRRIVHFDTSIDDAAQAAFDGGALVYVVPSEEYTKIEDTKATDQYVEHEIVKSYSTRGNVVRPGLVGGQGRLVKMLNQYLIDESEPAEFTETGAVGINPPYRLDPYQNIVNVKFSSAEAVMVGFTDASEGVNSNSLVSNDGMNWENKFPGNTSNAASGLGQTVVCLGKKYVACGKPRDGDKCFITVNSSGTIERGVMVDGSLQFTGVGSLPLGGDQGVVNSCVFAGDAFFISYNKASDISTKSYLAVSFDGSVFIMGIDPFPGVAGASQDATEAGSGRDPQPRPFGGCVAYDPKQKLYVTTGMFQRIYWADFIFGEGGGQEVLETNYFDRNFMSAVSSNGIGWTGQFFDTSQSSGLDGSGGIQGNNVVAASSVAFGNGVFVAVAGYKVPIPVNGPGTFQKIGRWGASVCVSKSGTGWRNVRLPSQTVTYLDTSLGTAVKFVKHKSPDKPNIDGFFVLTTISGFDPPSTGANPNLVLISEDGIGWQTVITRGADEKYGWILSILNKNNGRVTTV